MPDCAGLECGADPICGTDCGSCGAAETCSTAGVCEADCSDPCQGRECGVVDACGGQSCGSCVAEEICVASTGQCAANDLVMSGRTSLANARVVATIGAQELEATADGTGRFEIPFDALDLDAVVVLRATGSSARDEAFLGFASVVGTAGEIMSHAGADRIIDETEEPGLRVTELSTAWYAALFAANGRAAPANDAELRAAQRAMGEELDGSEMLEVAGGLRYIAGQRNQLPSPLTNTLALVEDVFMMREFIESRRKVDTVGSQLDPQMAEIAAERENGGRFEADELSSYFDELVESRSGQISGGGVRWDLYSGGRGRFQDFTQAGLPPLQALSWALDDGTVLVTFDTPVVQFESLDAEGIAARISDPVLRAAILNVIGVNGLLNVNRELTGAVITPLIQRQANDWVAISDESIWRFDEALQPFGIVAEAIETTELRRGSLWMRASSLEHEPLLREQIVGTWALRLVFTQERDSEFGVPAGAQYFGTAMVEFADDGTARARAIGVTNALDLTWELNADGILVVRYPSGAEQRYATLTVIRGIYGMMSWYQPDAATTYTDYGRDAKVDPSFLITPEVLNTDPLHYWQTTTNLGLTHPNANGLYPDWNYFGWRFESEDLAVRVTVESPPRRAALDRTYNWTVQTGTVAIELRRDVDGNMRCVLTDPTCVTFRRRVWEPVAMQDGLLMVIEADAFIADYAGYREGDFFFNQTTGAYESVLTGQKLDTSFVYWIVPRLSAYFVDELP